jgi:hypothetical protein
MKSYRNCRKSLNQNILKPTLKLNTVLFADDQVTLLESENLQTAAYWLIKVKEYSYINKENWSNGF